MDAQIMSYGHLRDVQFGGNFAEINYTSQKVMSAD